MLSNFKDMSRLLFGEETRLERLKDLKDPLIDIKERTDWKVFESELNKIFPEKENPLGGRPAYSKLLLFKILILQEYYGLSDKSVEYQVTDRLSFMRFLDLTIDDRVPDSNTVWNFRESLKKGNSMNRLFSVFIKSLRRKGIVVNKGSIIDATIVKAPIQRNSREENDEIKKANTLEKWSKKKKEHKDVDATWTKKHGKQFYGYKNHVKMDKKSKIITATYTTTASTHDSKAFLPLLEDIDQGQTLHMDSGYASSAIETVLEVIGIKARIIKKGVRGRELTDKEKAYNRRLSKIRCRVEHAFGTIKTMFGQGIIRTIGLQRAIIKNTLRTLTYNIQRSSYLQA